jgi:hypothetical protein
MIEPDRLVAGVKEVYGAPTKSKPTPTSKDQELEREVTTLTVAHFIDKLRDLGADFELAD